MVNKYKLKLTALFTTITLVMGMFIGFSVNAAESKNDNKAYDEAVKALKIFGVLDDGTDYTADAEVCREDMALYTAKLLNISQGTNAERYFVDVPADSYGTWAINALTQMGIFSVDDERTFRPMDSVEVNEVYKIITTVLGYENYAKVNGGYPMGYVKAMNIAKLNRISSNKVLFSDVAVMLYEALQAEVYEPVVFGNKTVEMKKSGNTLLSVYHNVYYNKGRIDSIGSASISDGANAEENEIEIDGTSYVIETDLYVPEYLGKYVKFFYKGKEKETKTIKYIVDEGNKDDIVIKISDVDSISEKRISYWDNEKKKEQNLEKSLWVYNGRVLDKDLEKTLNSLNKGYVIIRDTDDNGSFDSVFVWDYTNFIVKSKNDSIKTIYNKLGIGGFIKAEDYENVYVYDGKENSLKWLDIAEGMTLAVAPAKDNKVLTILSTGSEFNGELTGMSEDPLKLSVGSDKYEIEPSYLEEFKDSSFNVGGTYVYKLDVFGYVSYVYSGESDSAMKYAYLIDSAVNLDAMNESMSLRLLTADDKVEIIKFADTVRIDGVRYKEFEKMAKAFPKYSNGKIGKQVIRYELDGDGLIKNIDTVNYNSDYESENDNLTVVGDENFGINWYRSGRMGILSLINGSTTPVFSIPFDDRTFDDGDYAVTKANATFTDDGAYYSNIYKSSVKSEYCDMVLRKYEDMKFGKNTGIQTYLTMVTGVGEALDEDGNVAKCITGFENGNEVTYVIPSEVNTDNVGRGDIVRFRYNVRGEVTKALKDSDDDIIVLYDYSKYQGNTPTEWSGLTDDMTLYVKVNNAAYHNYRSDIQLSYGFAADKTSDALWLGAKSGDVITEVAKTNIPVIVYDPSLREENQIYKGTVDDIEDYKTVGASCSRIIYHTYIGAGRALFVYKVK